jgi:hypothetical protein
MTARWTTPLLERVPEPKLPSNQRPPQIQIPKQLVSFHMPQEISFHKQSKMNGSVVLSQAPVPGRKSQLGRPSQYGRLGIFVGQTGGRSGIMNHLPYPETTSALPGAFCCGFAIIEAEKRFLMVTTQRNKRSQTKINGHHTS